MALPLEVTDPSSVAELARVADDVTILVNNAGVPLKTSYLRSPLEQIRREFDVDFFGPLRTTRAFAPVIERNGGGRILNVHSVLSWIAMSGAYSATKSALWSQSNALRLELEPRGITVPGLHVGYVDTDMTAGIDEPKVSADQVAESALDGIEADRYEILVDDMSRRVKATLSGDLVELYPSLVQ
ncbi:short-chain dehydrogenase [Saccharothrix coeruleofusca]|uniref:Short-chain dehydrogenase n=1 Tax=Saccharothrix coeruleofusca TaxID=33919 RepID=A0A918ASA4_9PSEU|nr:short-chain dehydrogenase [Saccharothrix coeruleofusca]